MTGQREQAIRERAYAIWEQEGHPNGKDLDHWLYAEAEIGSCREYGSEQMRQDTDLSQSYLLDTSAFVALGLPVLEKLKSLRLYVSPYVFWERLCHLDENEDFGRGKGEFER